MIQNLEAYGSTALNSACMNNVLENVNRGIVHKLITPEVSTRLLLLRGCKESFLQLLVIDGFRKVAINPRLQSLIAFLS